MKSIFKASNSLIDPHSRVNFGAICYQYILPLVMHAKDKKHCDQVPEPTGFTATTINWHIDQSQVDVKAKTIDLK
eukprot:4959750-Ditylum_brightwellii.AAC.1